MNIAEFQLQFTDYLQQWCKAKRITYDQFPETVRALILHGIDLISSDGKRIRPYMACLAYKYHGGNDQKAIFQLGLILEILHVFALIHDDWMDGGVMRRGMPTAHILMESMLIADERVGAIKHASASQAILLGDLMFSWVNQELDRLSSNSELRNTFQQMVETVVLGQMIDIDSTTLHQISREQLDQKMLLKTASYTFTYPLLLGAILAGDQLLLQFYSQLGNALGLGFQIQDDLLDIIGLDTQKTPFADITNHQHSLCTYYVLNHGTEEHKALLSSLWGKEILAPHDQEELKSMFASSGANAFAFQEMNKYFDQAMSLLDKWSTNEECKQGMHSIVQLIAKRLQA